MFKLILIYINTLAFETLMLQVCFYLYKMIINYDLIFSY